MFRSTRTRIGRDSEELDRESIDRRRDERIESLLSRRRIGWLHSSGIIDHR